MTIEVNLSSLDYKPYVYLEKLRLFSSKALKFGLLDDFDVPFITLLLVFVMLLSLVSIILCDIELLPSWLLSENPMLESSFTDINDIEE